MSFPIEVQTRKINQELEDYCHLRISGRVSIRDVVLRYGPHWLGRKVSVIKAIFNRKSYDHLENDLRTYALGLDRKMEKDFAWWNDLVNEEFSLEIALDSNEKLDYLWNYYQSINAAHQLMENFHRIIARRFEIQPNYATTEHLNNIGKRVNTVYQYYREVFYSMSPYYGIYSNPMTPQYGNPHLPESEISIIN